MRSKKETERSLTYTILWSRGGLFIFENDQCLPPPNFLEQNRTSVYKSFLFFLTFIFFYYYFCSFSSFFFFAPKNIVYKHFSQQLYRTTVDLLACIFSSPLFLFPPSYSIELQINQLGHISHTSHPSKFSNIFRRNFGT